MTPPQHAFPSGFSNPLFGQTGLLICLLLAAGLSLSACSRRPDTDLPYLDMKTLADNPPRSLALLPTTDTSGHPEIAEPFRNAFYNAMASLPYHDRELNQIDAFLQRMAVRRGIPPEQLTPEMMVDPGLADCVIFSNIERVSRLYLFFYSHYRMDLDLTMVDTRSRRVLYKDRYRCYNRTGAPFFSIPGILGSTLFSLWHLRSAELEESLETSASDIARQLPTPPVLATGEKNLVIDNVEVTLPSRPLRAGDSIGIHVITNPGCQVSYSIGKMVHQQPMAEKDPGRYGASYVIKNGDDTSYCLVELGVIDAQTGDRLDYPVSSYPFSIDTTPPPRACVTTAQRLGGDHGLLLGLECLLEDVTRNAENPVAYHIYRREIKGPQFLKVASVPEPRWTDPDAKASVAYEYLVVTEDTAGNLSSRGQVRLIDAETP